MAAELAKLDTYTTRMVAARPVTIGQRPVT